MENIKKLPLVQPVAFIEQKNIRHNLAIIESYPHTLPWIYNYFFQLEMPADFEIQQNNPLSFCIDSKNGVNLIKWIQHHGLSKEMILKSWGSFVQFIVDSIDDDYYPIIPLNKESVIFYGYNINEAIFYTAAACELSYRFCQADFGNADEICSMSTEENINMLKFKKDESFSFTVHHIKDFIDEYLNSQSSNIHYALSWGQQKDIEYFYGLDVYKGLTGYITMCSELSHVIDERNIKALISHKDIILGLIKFLNQSDYLENEHATELISTFQLINEKTKALETLCAEYNKSKNNKLIQSILTELKSISDNESIGIKKLKQHIKI